MTRVTVLGSAGFIGGHVTAELARRGVACATPARDERLDGLDLGDVIYCIGLTADFRERPADTVVAHVTKLMDVLTRARVASLLYLSSTRIYRGCTDTSEDGAVAVKPALPDDLYNASKIMGESAALTLCSRGRVARLSNVYGGDFRSENFLASLCREAVTTRRVVLRSAPSSAKDYVSVRDVASLLVDIALRGTQRIYNVASGMNVSNAELSQALARAARCEVSFTEGAPTLSFPRIDIARVKDEFGFCPSSVVHDISSLVETWTNGGR